MCVCVCVCVCVCARVCVCACVCACVRVANSNARSVDWTHHAVVMCRDADRPLHRVGPRVSDGWGGAGGRPVHLPRGDAAHHLHLPRRGEEVGGKADLPLEGRACAHHHSRRPVSARNPSPGWLSASAFAAAKKKRPPPWRARTAGEVAAPVGVRVVSQREDVVGAHLPARLPASVAPSIF
eukprot:COSAG01_NODE_31017_length_605_cov_1.035573_1_plen_180_part_10